MVCTIVENLMKLDPAIHVPKNLCSLAYNAIKHTKWLENNGDNSLRILIRLLKDVRNRFPGMQSLSSRMIDLLSSFSIVNYVAKSSIAIPLPSAFKRAIQLMASGIFLAGSSGIHEPLVYNHKIYFNELNFEQMDMVCLTSQAILRLIYRGAYTQIFFEKPKNQFVNDHDSNELQSTLFESEPTVRLYPKAFIAPSSGYVDDLKRDEPCSDSELNTNDGLQQDASDISNKNGSKIAKTENQ
ncbi:hypothetical protein GJ496_002370 [Pomphorhynchus laevis]|nr:hypothetical protein GJ496_002370 [Pomphorhynchus laevis]